ncbi:MAG: PTS sugar transporter subunit IIC, partial [Clostridia bacterium]|nr:PTS sugar transporter subunit IIC [Clostridia bacterium]
VGQFMTFSSMKADGKDPVLIIVEILLMHFILPAVLTLVISEFMRKKNFIKPGDMSLETLN